MLNIQPPDNVSSQPDEATKKGMTDYTAEEAAERVLHINLPFFKYGTNDKTHAAAIVFSLLLFVAIIGITIAGIFCNNISWPEKIFNWLGSSFLFVAGFALGGTQNANKK